MSRIDIERYVRERLFGGTHAAEWRVGAEVELIALSLASDRPIPLESVGVRPALLPVLRSLARKRGWQETRSPYDVACFAIPGVGVLSFEPGGQLEISTRPFSSPTLLLAAVRGAISLLRSAAEGAGFSLLEIGLDPINDVADVPLVIPVQRYTRMARHFGLLGGEGLRMMKQTASFQVSLDVAPPDALEVWRVLNAVVPAVIAAFANSPLSCGRPGGDASTRSRIWQNTDPARTGIFPGDDAAAEYAGFALGAGAICFDFNDAPARPMGELLGERTVSEDQWRDHLSTLFPEVRPRGHLEFRACDSVADDGRAALLVLLCALARHAEVRRAVTEIVGAPSQDAYRVAPGADERLLLAAADAFRVAIASARAEPPEFWNPAELNRAERFISEYPGRRRTPAEDWGALLLRSA